MIAVKGRFTDGAAHPEEPVEGRDGQEVIITFLDDRPVVPRLDKQTSLSDIVDQWKSDTGIPDLAEQHDHYLHGTPKRP